MARYQKPNATAAKIMNSLGKLVIGKVGWSPQGAHLLEVRGRKSGRIQSVPVNPVTVNGQRFLVAPRGETQWVRNFRAAGEGVLRVGDKREPILGREVGNADKAEILRAYLDRWYWQVSNSFDVEKDATLDQLAAIAPNHPVFHIHGKETA